MKTASHANNTLSPLCRAAAFFAFLGFLVMTSCGEERPDRVSLMNQQAEALSGMADIMNSVSDGSDPLEASKKLETLAETFKNLKRDLRELASLEKLEQEEVDQMANHQAYAEANRSFFEALRRLQESGKGTPEMVLALQSIHDPAPMPGEGSPK